MLKNGQTLQGVAKNRSNYSLQLVDTKGILHLIQMNDVKQLTLSASTPMPGDFATRLSRDELRDLLAYLAAQDIRAEETKGIEVNDAHDTPVFRLRSERLSPRCAMKMWPREPVKTG